MIFAKELGLQQAHFKGDSEIVIKALKNGDMLFSSFGHVVREIQFHVTSLRSFSFSHIVFSLILLGKAMPWLML